jgi:copper transport protein
MRLGAIVLAFVAALSQAPAAWAHASLIRSEPVDRAVIARAPPALTLTFNEPVSPLALRLIGPGGNAAELTDVGSAGATLTVRLPAALPQGTHLLSWRVISADGHPVGGALTFSIGQPSATAPRLQPETDRALQPAIWIARFLIYLGLLVGVGGTFYAGWIARAPLPRTAQRIVAAALQTGLIAVIVSVGLQGLDVLGLPLPELRLPRVWLSGFSTAYGATALIAAAAMVLAVAAPSANEPAASWLSAVALAGVGAALAASGHASAAAPQLLTRPTVFVHGVAVALWVGALVPLGAVMMVPERRAAELMRFSRLMPAVIALLVASGSMLAIIQMQRIDALWTTDYGEVLFRKLVLVLLLLQLAAMNRYWLTPRVAPGETAAARWLGRTIVLECVIVVVVLGLVATWRFTPPPRSLFAAAAAPVHTHIHTDRAMANIEIAPTRDGRRRISIGVLDGQFWVLAAREVTLLLSKPEAGIEPLRLPAVQVDGATWRIDGVQLPAGGRWQARVDILINDFEKISIEDAIEIPR